MRMNNNAWISSVMTLAAALVPCFAVAEDAAPAAAAVEPVTLRVGHNNWIGYIGFYAAEQAGYFEEAGLHIEAKTFATPSDGLIPLANGDLDVSLSTLDSVLIYLGRSPDAMKIVYMNDTSDGADAMIAAEEIKTAADLKGKKVAITLGSCGEILLVKALESAGLSEKDIEMVNMDPDAAGAALKSGAVSAAVTWEPWISQLIGSQNANVIFSSKQAPNVILDCTAVRTGLDPEKAAAVKKFIEVMNRGNELAVSDPEKAAALVSDMLDLPQEEIVEMLKTVKLYGAAENKELLDGGVKPAAEEVLKLFESKGVIEKGMNLDGVFDSGMLP